MKISILSHNLSNNGFGRVCLLAEILSKRYDVEIIGPVKETGIWPPLKDCKLKIRSVPYRKFPGYLLTAYRIFKMIDGDVIYAAKPKMTSLIIGLFKKFRSKTPVVLDIDDWESAHFDFKGSILGQLGELLEPDSMLYVKIAEKLIKYADELTVVSDFFREKYGSRGYIVQHARDISLFDPSKFNNSEQKAKYGLELNNVIVFVGTVRPHKGVDDIITAIRTLNDKSIKLALFGTNNAHAKKLKTLYPDIVEYLGPVDFSALPEKLAMADLIILPQKNEPISRGQVPAKLIDAMAMAKPIISTNVSDIPKILEGCGIVVEPNDTEALSKAIKYIIDNPKEAEVLGKAARKKCVEQFSYEAVGNILYNIFDKYSANRKENIHAPS